MSIMVLFTCSPSDKFYGRKGLAGFSNIKKSVMPKLSSIDIDDYLTDFMMAEYYIKN